MIFNVMHATFRKTHFFNFPNTQSSHRPTSTVFKTRYFPLEHKSFIPFSIMKLNRQCHKYASLFAHACDNNVIFGIRCNV